MKTIVLEKPGQITRAETPEPDAPGPGEALVGVRRVGICGTDLHAFEGRQPFFEYPRILGHELGVEILDIGEGVEELAPGMRAAVEPYMNCGVCQPCRRGHTNCCERLACLGVHVDGGMRERILLPADKLHPSGSLDFDQLALVETLAIGAHAVGRANLEEGEEVLVIGAGPIGLGVVQFARAAGARIAVLERSAHRRKSCRELFGVEHCLEGGEDGVEQVRELLDGELPTAVFDATGSATSMCAAFQYVAHAGRLVFVGFQLEEIRFGNPEFHRRELTLLASRNAQAGDMRRVVRSIEEGRVDTRPWITHRATYEDLPERFPSWPDPEQRVLKAVLEL